LANGLIEKPVYQRRAAVLLTARALALEATDPGLAKALVIEATRFAPDLVPAAALAGRLLGKAGEARWAGRILISAWRKNPHPDVAETYAFLRPGDSARDRLARIQSLVREADSHRESMLALARAALDARELALARETLQPLLNRPTQRVAMLMAELEQLEHGDEGRAREWTGRAVHAARDPAWTADGFVSEQWLPVSPVTGRIDAFEWKVPLEELAGSSRVIDHARAPAGARTAFGEETSQPPRRLPGAGKATAADGKPPTVASGGVNPPLIAPTGPGKDAAAIVPVHVPDDPGPHAASLGEQERELMRSRPNRRWRRFGALFK
jgi:HemY protein